MRAIGGRLLDQVLLHGIVHALFPHSLHHSSRPLCAHRPTSDPRTGADQQPIVGRGVVGRVGRHSNRGGGESRTGRWQRQSTTEEKESNPAPPKLQSSTQVTALFICSSVLMRLGISE